MDEDYRDSSYIYVASPYSHKDMFVRRERFEAVVDFVVKQHALGEVCFSPIIHGHHITLRGNLPYDAEFWRRHNTVMLMNCSKVWVLQLSGVEESRGVGQEVAFAVVNKIPVEFIKP